MKILVIGSSSFSGRSFIKYQILKNPSLQIVGVNRTSLKETPFDPLGSLKNEIQEFNMDLDTDCNRIAKLVKEFEITHILNFAAMSMVAESWNNPSTWYRTNVESLANLIRALDYEDCKIEKFIQFSTPEVYGNTNTLIKENWSFAPSTPYAISRAAGDWHLKSLYDTRKFPVIFTRAANVFGEHQRLYRIVPKTIFSILRGFKLPLQGGGKSVRSFIHIDDVSSALCLLLDKGEVGSSYHISTEEFLTIAELISIICELMGTSFTNIVSETEDRPGKDQAYMLASSKLREEIGWKDLIGLGNGLRRTVSWLEDNLISFRDSDLSYRVKVANN